jgi:FAD/FMN-containing dehydrogenase
MDMVLADGSFLSCSPGTNAELFWATVGGMGLTGFISSATIQLRRCCTSYYKVDYRKARNIDETLEVLAQTAGQYTYSVGWIDCLGGSEKGGRSVLMLANDAAIDDIPHSLRSDPLTTKEGKGPAVPFQMPGWSLNRMSVGIFNYFYYSLNREGPRVAHYRSYFYPLDSISNWNRIYGKCGFIQYQALFPRETSRAGLKKVLQVINDYGLASFLAVIKTCGEGNRGLLSYLHEGVTLALDIPNAGPRLFEMSRKLDTILLDHGGRLYLAKDALTSAETFARMYPQKDQFMEIKARYDPAGRFVSEQAKRLHLMV